MRLATLCLLASLAALSSQASPVAAQTITEFSAGITPAAAPQGITAGPDGNIWFTETSGNRIGRFALAAPSLPAPVQGKTANLEPVSGTVLVKLPGSATFIPLGEARSVPVGTIVDTRNGVVELTTADKAGKLQTAQFKYGQFRIAQSAKKGAFTELVLVGPLAGCGRSSGRLARGGAGDRPAQSAAGRGRRLWGSGKGRFRTRGSRGSAGIRGTIWQVEDRCNNTTKLRSFKGKVTVRDFLRKRTGILRSGEGYTAPGPRAQKWGGRGRPALRGRDGRPISDTTGSRTAASVSLRRGRRGPR